MVSRYSRKRGGSKTKTITRQPGSRNVLSNIPTLPTLLKKYSELQQYSHSGEKELVTPPVTPRANNTRKNNTRKNNTTWITMPTPIRKLKGKNVSNMFYNSTIKQRPTRNTLTHTLNLQERFNRLRKMKNNLGPALP